MQKLQFNLSWLLVKTAIRLRFPRVKRLTIAELADWLHQPQIHQPTPLLLDARKPAEYQVSHLAAAQLVPADSNELQQMLSAAAQINQPIVIYCSVGYRSAKLANRLQQTGFTQVCNLEGSIFEWANADHPVYREQESVQQVHPYNSNWGKLLRSDLHFYEITPTELAATDSVPTPSKGNADDRGCS